MTVVRDPDSGKFMSVGDAAEFDDVDDPDVYSGTLLVSIDAADLTTGTDNFLVTGDVTEVIDWTPYLDADEVFVCHAVEMVAQLVPDRTATAEHHVSVDYELRSASTLAADAGNGDVQTQGAVTTFVNDSDESDVLVAGGLSGHGDFADSVNGLAAGAAIAPVTHSVNWPAMALNPPTFDEDDELHIPQSLEVKGSDDQGINVRYDVVCYGRTVDY